MVSYALCPAMGLMVVSVMAVALAVGRQEWQPQQLPRNQVYRLFRMLLPNPLAGQIPGVSPVLGDCDLQLEVTAQGMRQDVPGTATGGGGLRRRDGMTPRPDGV